VIISSQRPLSDNTQRSLQIDIHASGGIRTHNLSRQVASDLRPIIIMATGTGIEHLWGIKNCGVCLSISWSPVTTLFAIQVYRFCELCRRIVTYPVQIFMYEYLRMTRKYLGTKNYNDKRNSGYDSQLSHTAIYKSACVHYAQKQKTELDELLNCISCSGTRWRSLLRSRATSRKDRFPLASLGFFIDLILPAPLWPLGRLSL
jgi:hypothetical protein